MTGTKVSAEDAFAARDMRAYAEFLHQTPWYEYPFASRLVAFWRMAVDRFLRDPKAAAEVVKDDSVSSSQRPELAAWTMVANVLLNLDETITKE